MSIRGMIVLIGAVYCSVLMEHREVLKCLSCSCVFPLFQFCCNTLCTFPFLKTRRSNAISASYRSVGYETQGGSRVSFSPIRC